ncbi:MAG: GNAT family N-acetyltransferase [Pyrinomonadaceae bacterium]|jgi:L-amino acid N-acyltransferase YncA|nr:GNAT family N-acetyltransferase [Pyrinomonadaceae bacterium]
MKIRLANAVDAKNLVAFNQAMALETEGKTLVDEKISNGVSAVFSDEKKGFYVVAEDENSEIVGGLMVTFEWSDWRNAWFWWIQSVYILPKARGKSIYSKLYQFVKTEAEKQNVCGIRLYVEHDNINAQKVYEHLGMNQSHYLMYEVEL